MTSREKREEHMQLGTRLSQSMDHMRFHLSHALAHMRLQLPTISVELN